MRSTFLLSLALLITACSTGGYVDNGYEESNEYVGNPYDEDSGHGAGYKWAEETGGDCDANSDSFNEGCEEYYQQSNQ